MNLKAQVTTFMIIGLIILALTALVIGVRNSVILSKLETRVDPSVESIDQFYQACLYSSSVQALETLGRRGGYIDTYSPNLPVISLSNTVYWYPGRTPSIESMQSELSTEISRILPLCLNDFKTVDPSFSVTQAGELKVTVVISETDVSIFTVHPLDIVLVSTSKRYQLKNFKSTLPVRLKYLWESAGLINVDHDKDLELSQMALNLLTLDMESHISSTNRAPQVLLVDSISKEKTFKSRLYYYFPLIIVENTLYPNLKPYSNQEKLDMESRLSIPSSLTSRDLQVLDAVYRDNHLRWTVDGLDKYDNLRVIVRYYPSYETDFYQVPNYATSSGLSASQYTYYVYFPVDVEIIDTLAYNGAGYSYHIALPVSIENNKIAHSLPEVRI